MIRLVALSVGCVAVTGGLLWFMGSPADPTPTPEQEVSRNAPLSIHTIGEPASRVIAAPAIAPGRPAPIAPTAVPKTPELALASPAVAPPAPRAELVAASPAVKPAEPKPALLTLQAAIKLPQAEPQAAPAAQAPETANANAALRAMSFGMIQQSEVEAPEPRVNQVLQQPSRSYEVKQGDSLAGISYRFFGTTAASLQILQANSEILADVTDLRPGMVLDIPLSP